MKLLKKNTQFLLIYLPIILIICSVFFYILLNSQVNHLHDKILHLKQENVLRKLEEQKGDIDPNFEEIGEFGELEDFGEIGEFTINEIKTNAVKNYNLITEDRKSTRLNS